MTARTVTTSNLEAEKLFNLLSDQTRLRCLFLLQQEGELCVCELTYALDMIQPKISRHLALLRKFNIVADKRQGIWIYYRLHPKLPTWICRVIEATMRVFVNIKPYQNDLRRLKAMPNRPFACDTSNAKC